MTIDDEGVDRSETAARRPSRRRRVAVAGAAGLAVVLGGGTYLIATAGGGETTAVGEAGAPTPMTEVSAAAPSGDPAIAAGSASSGAASPGPVSSASRLPASGSSRTGLASSADSTLPANPAAVKPADPAAVKKEIQAARDAAARDGYPLQPAIIPKGGVSAAVSTRTEETANGTIRITAARTDLTGQQGQQLAADGGTPAGHARCTRRLHFSNAQQPKEIPSLLLCWRTSAKRSVVTLAVTRGGRPSAEGSAAVIDREWAKLR